MSTAFLELLIRDKQKAIIGLINSFREELEEEGESVPQHWDEIDDGELRNNRNIRHAKLLSQLTPKLSCWIEHYPC